MAAATPADLTIPNLDADAFARLQAKAQESGLGLSGPSGAVDVAAKGHTVGIRWSYDAQAQSLAFTITQKPLFWPKDMVVDELKRQIDAALSGTDESAAISPA